MSTAQPTVEQPTEQPERALIEAFLDLEEIEPNLYRADNSHLWKPYKSRGVFGGQVVGQALVAATKTVSASFQVHSLHSYFLLPGSSEVPIIYHVQRIRDGKYDMRKSFATRTVRASQHGRCIFTCTCSFHVPEDSLYNYQVNMPFAPEPESLMSERERMRSLMNAPSVPAGMRRELEDRMNDSAPIDLRLCEDVSFKDIWAPNAHHPQRSMWMKSEGQLDDDTRLHQCVLAYASDHQLLWTALRPLGIGMLSRPEGVQMIVSLDHTVWFHAPFRADEWLFYEMDCDHVGGNRAQVHGRVYTRDGRLVASVAQEGVLRIGQVGDRKEPASKL